VLTGQGRHRRGMGVRPRADGRDRCAGRVLLRIGHWFGPQLGRWMTDHHVTSAALTDALIFMALGMLITRVIAIAVRARNPQVREQRGA
jgi:hypothetical protein